MARNPDQIVADVGGDLVLMSVDQGEYFGITGVGSRVWELLATPIAVENIVRVICDEYAVEATVCQSDIESFVEELIQLGLVSAV